MRALCERSELLKGVRNAARAVSSRSTLPILANLFVEAKDNILRLVGTDLEVGIECTVPARVEEPGALTIPAKVLQQILSSLPGEEIDLALEEANMALIRCGKSEYRLLGLPADEFPLLPQVGEEIAFSIDPGLLREVIRETIFAASKDEARAILMGALFSVRGETLRVVATDTHRLALSEAPLSQPLGREVEFIVPASALKEVARMAGQAIEDVMVKGSENQLLFSFGQMSLITRLIEGQFPNYEQVIPKEAKLTIIADRGEFLGAIRRLNIVAKEDANRVVFNLSDGELVMSAESQEVGRAEERLAVDAEGEPFEVAFNAQYLAEALNVIGTKEVRFDLTGPVNPGVIKPVGGERTFLYVVMPMQIL